MNITRLEVLHIFYEALKYCIYFTILTVPKFPFIIESVNSCNEAVCGSIVSKCLLLKPCMCLLDDKQCHKSCFECLGSYNIECCPCLEFCPRPKKTVFDHESYVEDFEETIPGLFDALTEYPDELDRWITLSYPVSSKLEQNQMEDNSSSSESNSVEDDDADDYLNCTVIFLKDCLSLNKCRKSCLHMGASSFRWFHDGCCECNGEYCIQYGIPTGRCENCPEMEFDDYNDDDLEYDDDDYLEEETM